MSELYTPKPSRLLLPTADELSAHTRHFVPYKLPEEHPRRDAIRGQEGARVPSDELAGLLLCIDGLRRARTPKEAAEIGFFFAAAAFGGCKYLLSTHRNKTTISPRERQNRYGEVPILATPSPAQRPSTEELRDRAVVSLEAAVPAFYARLAAVRHRAPVRKRAEIDLLAGRLLFRSAGMMAVIGAGDTVADPANYLSDHEVQLISRDRCMQAINAAQDTSQETGTHSSFIQLTSTKAPFSVELQRAASPEVEALYLGVQQVA